jgi:DNA-binding MarR family transcriptional regulator
MEGAAGASVEPLVLADRLRPVLLRISRQLRREVAEPGVSSTQVSLLIAIRQKPGIGLTELAAHEGMTTASLCVHIDHLQAAGLVERSRTDDKDRRRVDLRITENAEITLANVRSRRTAWLADRLEILEPHEREAIEAAIGPLESLVGVRP